MRKEEEAAEEAKRQKAQKARREFEEKEYQRWMTSEMKVLKTKGNTYESAAEKIQKQEEVKKVLEEER